MCMKDIENKILCWFTTRSHHNIYVLNRYSIELIDYIMLGQISIEYLRNIHRHKLYSKKLQLNTYGYFETQYTVIAYSVE